MLGKHGIGKTRAGTRTGPGKMQKNPMPPKERERKERKARKGKWSKDGKGDGKDHFSNAASESSNAPTLQPKAIAASTFFTTHNFANLLEIGRKEEVPDDVPPPLTEQVYMATPESETSYLTHALTPTSMVLDLGCTRAMTSSRTSWSSATRIQIVDFGIG